LDRGQVIIKKSKNDQMYDLEKVTKLKIKEKLI